MSDCIPKILVTGGSGFIGKHLISYLLDVAKVNVTIVVRHEVNVDSRVQVFVHDGSTENMLEIFRDAAPDCVIHLASKFIASHSSGDIGSLVNSNLMFGLQLLEAMKETGCKRFVNVGTAWQHYDSLEYNPVCLYAATKQAFETLIDYYVSAHAFTVISLLLHDTYGPNDQRGKLINLLIQSALTGRVLQLSPGKQKIDLVHVADVISALAIAMQQTHTMSQPDHLQYMVSAGKHETIQELVEKIENVTGLPLNVEWGARPYRDREVMTPWSGGHILPAWLPRIQFEKGVAEIAQELRNNNQ